MSGLRPGTKSNYPKCGAGRIAPPLPVHFWRRVITVSATVKIEGVSKRFGGFDALNNINLTIESGSFVTVLGPSGSGKSTTLRIIGGFEMPDEGRVLLDGTDITWLPPEARDINTTFQGYALFPHMTVAENVAFGLKTKRVRAPEIERRVRDALELVRLADYGGRSVTNLSGGEKQRIALARAIVNEPQVLLLDEPLSALDLKLRRQMQIELKHLQRQLGITFVYVTHDQGEALSMSDKVVVMNRARIEQIGTPEEVYRKPKTEFVADFLGEANILTGTAIGVGQVPDRIRVQVGGHEWEAPVASGTAPTRQGTVRIGLRPECIVVGEDAVSMENRVDLQIKEAVYLGNSWELVLENEDLRLKSWSAARDVMQPLRPGGTVKAGWASDDMVLLQ